MASCNITIPESSTLIAYHSALGVELLRASFHTFYLLPSYAFPSSIFHINTFATPCNTLAFYLFFLSLKCHTCSVNTKHERPKGVHQSHAHAEILHFKSIAHCRTTIPVLSKQAHFTSRARQRHGENGITGSQSTLSGANVIPNGQKSGSTGSTLAQDGTTSTS